MSLAIRDSERKKEGMNKLIEEPSDAIDPTYTSLFFFGSVILLIIPQIYSLA